MKENQEYKDKQKKRMKNYYLNNKEKYNEYQRPGRVAQWSAHPLRCPRSWVLTQPHPRRTKRAFALCQFGGLNEAKTFFFINEIIKELFIIPINDKEK